MLFHEYARGIDMTVGYLLGFEEVLAAHDHGHYRFSLDKAIDATFKKIVKQNMRDATEVLATLQLQWPKMCTALCTFRAARQILNSGKGLVEHLKHFGGLHENEIERLFDLIAKASYRLKVLSPIEALPVDERENFIPETLGALTPDRLEAAMQRLSPQSRAPSVRKRVFSRGFTSNWGASQKKVAPVQACASERDADAGPAEIPDVGAVLASADAMQEGVHSRTTA